MLMKLMRVLESRIIHNEVSYQSVNEDHHSSVGYDITTEGALLVASLEVFLNAMNVEDVLVVARKLDHFLFTLELFLADDAHAITQRLLSLVDPLSQAIENRSGFTHANFALLNHALEVVANNNERYNQQKTKQVHDQEAQ